MSMQVKQQGFTLIELIVVITILGILAAFALPRFVDLQRDARIATLNGLAGSLKSASAMVHAKALAKGQTAGTLDIGDGQSVRLSNGYATTATIGNALQDLTGFSLRNGKFTLTGAPTPAECYVQYTAATSSTAPATVGTPVTNGC
ncbi:type II secretion system protein [Thermithiobacillus plumbiphilus]|uniref:Type II secretion system protein n=1 Tax=Thermithiobacillus plumbiphilus TaxID=1729899 RepID=A0ABU9D644_9PROT